MFSVCQLEQLLHKTLHTHYSDFDSTQPPGDYESALRITHSASSIDCMALTAQILLQMNRVDLARKEVI